MLTPDVTELSRLSPHRPMRPPVYEPSTPTTILPGLTVGECRRARVRSARSWPMLEGRDRRCGRRVITPMSDLGQRGATVLTIAAALLALAAAPAQTKTPNPARVVLTGASEQRIAVCGAVRRARVAGVGSTVAARIPGRRRVLSVERCRNGRWVERARRLEGAVPTASDGDFRIRPAGRRGRAAYLRVGVGEIVDAPVTFRVRNENESLVSCATDGCEYDIHGSLVGPRAALSRPQAAATLYLHGLSYGEWSWRLQAVPGYDYAVELARLGHVSVAIDRLGYLASAGPDGNDICLGSQADIAHQIVHALRQGEYVMAGAAPTSFARVTLADHSIGGLVAELAAYSFGEIDGLVVMGYDDSWASLTALTTALGASGRCSGGGEERAGAGTQPHYAYYGETDADFQAAHTSPDMDPAVVAAVTKMRTRDPCGDLTSIVPALTANELSLSGIHVPVLLVLGSKDALFPPPGGRLQAGRYLGAASVKYVEIPGAPHGLTYSRQAPQVRAAVSKWLIEHGL